MGKRVPIASGPFLLFGSPFIIQGPYFQCFGNIHAKNVKSFCMYTTMSKLELSVLNHDLLLEMVSKFVKTDSVLHSGVQNMLQPGCQALFLAGTFL